MERASATRNDALDGLRGYAALTVALGHSVLQVVGIPIWFTSVVDFSSMSTLNILKRLMFVPFPQDAAVSVFFVLSGHVLWESFARKDMASFATAVDYVFARLYRLLPSVIASCILVGLLVVPNSTARELASSMVLLSNGSNYVLWSLQVELPCSLAIFAAWLLCGNSPARLLGLTSIAIAASCYEGITGIGPIFYFPAFCLGGLIGAVPQRAWHSKTLLVGGLAALPLASLFFRHLSAARYIEMGAATAVVGFAATKMPSILTNRVALFLGKISYPFYLTHTIGLLLIAPFVLTHLRHHIVPQFAISALVSIAITIPLAWLIHILVEMPVMRGRFRFSQAGRWRRPGGGRVAAQCSELPRPALPHAGE